MSRSTAFAPLAVALAVVVAIVFFRFGAAPEEVAATEEPALTEATSKGLDYGLEIDVAGEANGTIVIDLFEDTAPLHTAQIVMIANQGLYNGVVFHRVIEGFMAQTGDVEFGRADGDLARAGMGGSDLPNIPAEFSKQNFDRAIVGMARAQDPNSANSQFFIMFAEGPFLNENYTIVGEVISGMEVVDLIKRGTGANGAVVGAPDVMTDVRVTEQSDGPLTLL
ncbi:peptidylprolyl isomerase [Cognatiyoonia sp.]|uniref:peptidylprolyl isomerase n=1 Tax=Cognatiyoonia sp. TaxID=2211652 RepID=UPI003F697188